MPDLFPTDAVHNSLAPTIAAAYSKCLRADDLPLDTLRGAVDGYLEALRATGAEDAFLDLGTAEKVAAGCRRLVALLEETGSKAAHAAVQAAVVYFVLEDDAEQDDSVIGFDDDLQVVVETFKALGWSDGGVLA